MYIFFFFFFTTYLTAFPIEITDKNSYDTITHSLYTEALDVNESPLNLKNREWKKSTDEFTTLNKEHQYYWMKFTIHNNSFSSKELYLLDERRYVFNLTYFIVKDNKIIKSIDSGCMVNKNHSEFGSSLEIFSLDIERDSSVDIFIKI